MRLWNKQQLDIYIYIYLITVCEFQGFFSNQGSSAAKFAYSIFAYICLPMQDSRALYR